MQIFHSVKINKNAKKDSYIASSRKFYFQIVGYVIFDSKIVDLILSRTHFLLKFKLPLSSLPKNKLLLTEIPVFSRDDAFAVLNSILGMC